MKISKFQSGGSVVEAIQWAPTDDPERDDVTTWLTQSNVPYYVDVDEEGYLLTLRDLPEDLCVRTGGWVVRNGQGEFYPLTHPPSGGACQEVPSSPPGADASGAYGTISTHLVP